MQSIFFSSSNPSDLAVSMWCKYQSQTTFGIWDLGCIERVLAVDDRFFDAGDRLLLRPVSAQKWTGSYSCGSFTLECTDIPYDGWKYGIYFPAERHIWKLVQNDPHLYEPRIWSGDGEVAATSFDQIRFNESMMQFQVRHWHMSYTKVPVGFGHWILDFQNEQSSVALKCARFDLHRDGGNGLYVEGLDGYCAIAETGWRLDWHGYDCILSLRIQTQSGSNKEVCRISRKIDPCQKEVRFYAKPFGRIIARWHEQRYIEPNVIV